MTTISAGFPFEYFILDRVVYEGKIACRIGRKLVRERVRDSDCHSCRFVGLALCDSNGRLNVGPLKSSEWIVAPDLVDAGWQRNCRISTTIGWLAVSNLGQQDWRSMHSPGPPDLECTVKSHATGDRH
jgi:hypothetical protein